VVPFLGLVVVCGVGLWFVSRLAKENRIGRVRNAVLAEDFEDMAIRELTLGQQEALDAHVRL